MSEPLTGERSVAANRWSGEADRTWRTKSSRLLVAILAACFVLLLRETGVLVGVAAILLLAACFVLAPGPSHFSDRFLLFAALCIGWLPLIGWLPGIEVRIDVPGVLLAVAVAVVVLYQLGPRDAGTRTVALPTAAEWIALALGVIAALWWARPFAGLTDSGLLGALQHSGFDNASHFSMYRSNLELGSFIQARPHLANGAARLGYDYPQGMHQAWAQVTRLFQPHPGSSVGWLLRSYLDMLLLTAGGVVTLGSMAICRLCRRDVLVAVPAMAVIIAFFTVGTYMPFDGYANYALAIISVATAVTLLVRPTMHPMWNFIAVAGLGLVAAYNWYPLLILMAPALVVAALRAVAALHGRTRSALIAGIVATAVFYVLPVTIFSHLGLSWLNQTAGFATPWDVFMLVITALFAVACARQASNPDLTTNSVLGGPAVLGGASVGLIAAYEVHSTGTVQYYGQKSASAVLAVCAVVLVAIVAHHFSLSKTRQKLSLPLATLLAVLLAVAALQTDGYVGPSFVSAQTGYGAAGLVLHNALRQQPKYDDDAAQLLLAAQMSQGRPGTWWYLEPNPPSGIPFYLATVWFWVLQGDPAHNEKIRPDVPLQLDGSFSSRYLTDLILSDFPDPEKNGFHLFVPAWLREAVVERSRAWSARGRLIAFPAVTAQSG